MRDKLRPLGLLGSTDAYSSAICWIRHERSAKDWFTLVTRRCAGGCQIGWTCENLGHASLRAFVVLSALDVPSCWASFRTRRRRAAGWSAACHGLVGQFYSTSATGAAAA